MTMRPGGERNRARFEDGDQGVPQSGRRGLPLSRRGHGNRSPVRLSERAALAATGLGAWVAGAGVLLIAYFLLREAVTAWVDPVLGTPLTLAHLWWGQPPSAADGPLFVWQPIAVDPKYSLVPLAVGTAKVALVALVVAWPLGILAALWASEAADSTARHLTVAAMELAGGVPTVILGAFGLVVLAAPLQRALGTPSPLSALLAGILLGLWLAPAAFRLAYRGLRALPEGTRTQARALGLPPEVVLGRIVLPAAAPWAAASAVTTFAQAAGETMIALMVSGNAAIVSWTPLDSARTLAATVGAEMGEVIYGDTHYSVLFLIGVLLLAVSLAAHHVTASLTTGRAAVEEEAAR